MQLKGNTTEHRYSIRSITTAEQSVPKAVVPSSLWDPPRKESTLGSSQFCQSCVISSRLPEDNASRRPVDVHNSGRTENEYKI